ncbi:hypothetical protein ACTZWT_22780 [Rhodopseudomonas sp. NSM]|uniref:hypothetical protein n=1 Tax=Rhodopseudomonas sp. NSM TaxID=3457630 RepID=UPI0040369D5E
MCRVIGKKCRYGRCFDAASGGPQNGAVMSFEEISAHELIAQARRIFGTQIRMRLRNPRLIDVSGRSSVTGFRHRIEPSSPRQAVNSARNFLPNRVLKNSRLRREAKRKCRAMCQDRRTRACFFVSERLLSAGERGGQ